VADYRVSVWLETETPANNLPSRGLSRMQPEHLRMDSRIGESILGI
jgi:hypothetical protein